MTTLHTTIATTRSARSLTQAVAQAACGLAMLSAAGTFSAQAQSVSILPSLTEVQVGATFSLDVQASGFPDRIYGGGYNLAFDPTVLQLDNVQIPTNWELAKSTGLLDTASGTVSDIYFNTYAAPIAGDFLTASLKFTAIGAGSTQVRVTASNDFPFGDIDGNAVTVSFNPATVNVTAVPEPGSLAMVLAGMAGLMGVRRLRCGTA